MRLLKRTEEYRCESELSAKEEMENLRQGAAANGYQIDSCGYTYKTKKANGEIIDECWVLKVVKNFGGVWDEG